MAGAPGARCRPARFQRLRVIRVAHRRARGRRQSRAAAADRLVAASWERTCGRAAMSALTLNAFHRWVSDTEDFTPVGPPDAWWTHRETSATRASTARRWWRARRCESCAARRPISTSRGSIPRSPIRSPAAERPISEFQDLLLSAGFRQDLPRAAWGVSYTQQVGQPFVPAARDRSRTRQPVARCVRRDSAGARPAHARGGDFLVRSGGDTRAAVLRSGSPRAELQRGAQRTRAGALVPAQHFRQLLSFAFPRRAAVSSPPAIKTGVGHGSGEKNSNNSR